MQIISDKNVGGNITLGVAASRCVISMSSECMFYVCDVSVDGVMDLDKLCNVYSNGWNGGTPVSFGLRPCFSLRSDIKITGGDGQSETIAYTMRYLEDKIQNKREKMKIEHDFILQKACKSLLFLIQ